MEVTLGDHRKTQAEYVATIVQEAKHTIESVSIPTNPKDPSCTVAAWRLRPSELRAIAIQDFLDPAPQWGLKVNLANLCLGPAHCETIARAMILNRTVTSLDLSGCDMGTSGATNLAHCLGRNQVLRHLNINSNLIDAEGAVRVASLVGKLETLHVACNRIGDGGALALAEALATSTTMKFLNVRGNGIRLFPLYRLVEVLDPTILNRLSDELKTLLAESRAAMRADDSEKAKLVSKPSVADISSSGHSVSRDRTSVFAPSFESSPTMTKRNSGIFNITTSNNDGSTASNTTVEKRMRKSTAMFGDRHEGGGDLGPTPSPTVPALAVDAPHTPIDAQPAGAPRNTSCNALWLNGNLDAIPKELSDQLNKILTTRVPMPPEGLNQKKKKGKGKK